MDDQRNLIRNNIVKAISLLNKALGELYVERNFSSALLTEAIDQINAALKLNSPVPKGTKDIKNDS